MSGRKESYFLPKDVSEGDNLHFYASQFLWLFEFSQVLGQDFEGMGTYWQEDVIRHQKSLGYSFLT